MVEVNVSVSGITAKHSYRRKKEETGLPQANGSLDEVIIHGSFLTIPTQ
jgi:hypothetical protein